METALLATIGVVFAGALSLLGVVLAQIASRLRNVELDLLKARLHERALWAWARRHLDLYYRYRREDAPDPEPVPGDTE